MAHGLYDHSSILKLIEWRWGLAPLTPRDSAANNLADVLDFTGPPRLSAPQWNVDFQVALPCLLAGTQPLGPGSKSSLGSAAVTTAETEWAGLRQQALAHGWTLPAG